MTPEKKSTASSPATNNCILGKGRGESVDYVIAATKDFPLLTYIWRAIHLHRRFLVDAQDGPPLSTFCRIISGHDRMAGVNADEALIAVESHLTYFAADGIRARWETRGRPRSGDPWERFLDLPRERAVTAFLESWMKLAATPAPV